jgi:hypothetical protein
MNTKDFKNVINGVGRATVTTYGKLQAKTLSLDSLTVGGVQVVGGVTTANITNLQNQITSNDTDITNLQTNLTASLVKGSLQTLSSGDSITLDLTKNTHILDFTNRTTNLTLLSTTATNKDGTEGMIYIKQKLDSVLTIDNYSKNFRFENNTFPVFNRVSGTRYSGNNNIDILSYKVLDSLVYVKHLYENLSNDITGPTVTINPADSTLLWNGDSFVLENAGTTKVTNIISYLQLVVTDQVGGQIYTHTNQGNNNYHIKITIEKQAESGIGLNTATKSYNVITPNQFDTLNKIDPGVVRMSEGYNLYTLFNDLPLGNYTKSGYYKLTIVAKDFHGNKTSRIYPFRIKDTTRPTFATSGVSKISKLAAVTVDTKLNAKGFSNVDLYATSQVINTTYTKDSNTLAQNTILGNAALFGLTGTNGSIDENDIVGTDNYSSLRVIDIDSTAIGKVSHALYDDVVQAGTITEGKYFALCNVEAKRRLKNKTDKQVTLADLDVADEIVFLRLPVRVIDINAPIISVKNYTAIEQLEVKGERVVVQLNGSSMAGGVIVDDTRWATWKDDIQSEYVTDSVITVTVINKTSTHPYFGQGSSKSFAFDGVEAKILRLIPGKSYEFNQSDGSNLGNTLYITVGAQGSIDTGGTAVFTANGSAHSYSAGFNPGNAGAKLTITIGAAVPITTVVYSGSRNQQYMGNQVLIRSGAARGGYTTTTDFDASTMDLGTSTQITAYAMLLTLASGTLSQAVNSSTLQPLPDKFSKRSNSIIKEVKKGETFDFATLAVDSTTVLSGVAALVYFIADEGINNWLHSDNLWTTNLDSFLAADGSTHFDSVVIPNLSIESTVIPGVTLDSQLPRALGRAYRFFDILDRDLPTFNVMHGNLNATKEEYISQSPIIIKRENTNYTTQTINIPDIDSLTFNDNEDKPTAFTTYFNNNAKIEVIPMENQTASIAADTDATLSNGEQAYSFGTNTVKLKYLGDYKIKYKVQDDYHRVFHPTTFRQDSFTIRVVDETYSTNNVVNFENLLGTQLTVSTIKDPALTFASGGFFVDQDSYTFETGDEYGIDSSTINIFAYLSPNLGNHAANGTTLTKFLSGGYNTGSRAVAFNTETATATKTFQYYDMKHRAVKHILTTGGTPHTILSGNSFTVNVPKDNSVAPQSAAAAARDVFTLQMPTKSVLKEIRWFNMQFVGTSSTATNGASTWVPNDFSNNRNLSFTVKQGGFIVASGIKVHPTTELGTIGSKASGYHQFSTPRIINNDAHTIDIEVSGGAGSNITTQNTCGIIGSADSTTFIELIYETYGSDNQSGAISFNSYVRDVNKNGGSHVNVPVAVPIDEEPPEIFTDPAPANMYLVNETISYTIPQLNSTYVIDSVAYDKYQARHLRVTLDSMTIPDTSDAGYSDIVAGATAVQKTVIVDQRLGLFMSNASTLNVFNGTTDSTMLLKYDSLVITNFPYKFFCSSTDDTGNTARSIINLTLKDTDRATITGLTFANAVLSVDTDGEYNAKTNVTRSTDKSTINFPPFTITDSTLQFKPVISTAQETTIVHRYLAADDNDFGLRCKVIGATTLVLDSTTVIGSNFSDGTINSLTLDIKIPRSTLKTMMKASGIEPRVYHTSTTVTDYSKSLKLDIKLRDANGIGDSRVINFLVDDDQTPVTQVLKSGSNAPLTFDFETLNSGQTKNIQQLFNALQYDIKFTDNHDTEGVTQDFYVNTENSFRSPGTLLDSSMTQLFDSSVTARLREPLVIGEDSHTLTISQLRDTSGKTSTITFPFKFNVYRETNISIVGNATPSTNGGYPVILVNVPAGTGESAKVEFRNDLINALNGVGAAAGAFQDPYQVLGTKKLVLNTDYEFDSSTITTIVNDIVAARSAAGKSNPTYPLPGRAITGIKTITYRYKNLNASITNLSAATVQVNRYRNSLVKLDVVDTAAPTVIFDSVLTNSDNRLLNSANGNTIATAHEVVLGTPFNTILSLSTSPILTTFIITENSTEAVKLKVYVKKEDVVLSNATQAETVTNIGFTLPSNNIARNTDNWIYPKQTGRASNLSELLNINRLIDVSQINASYATGANKVRFNKEGLVEVFFEYTDSQNNATPVTTTNSGTNMPYKYFIVKERRAAYPLLNKSDGTAVTIPGSTNGQDQDAYYNLDAQLLTGHTSSKVGQVPITNYNESAYQYSATASVLSAAKVTIDLLNPNYVEYGVSVQTLTPRMTSEDKLNSNGNGFSYRIPVEIKVVKPDNSTIVLNYTSNNTTSAFSAVETYFNTLSNNTNNIGEYYVYYKTHDIRGYWNEVYRKVSVEQRFPTVTNTQSLINTFVGNANTVSQATTLIDNSVTVTSAGGEISAVSFNKDTVNLNLSGVDVIPFTDRSGGNDLTYKYKIMTKAEFLSEDSTTTDVDYFDAYNTATPTVSAGTRSVPSTLLTNLISCTGTKMSANNLIYLNKAITDEIYLVIQATDPDSTVMPVVNRLSKPSIFRLRVDIDPRVYLLGPESISIVQYQQYVDRYVEIVDPLSLVSSYAIYNTNLATTVHTSARFEWSALPETNVDIVDISQNTGVRYIKYTYTTDFDSSRRGARYFKADGELGSGVPTRTVTVTDANTSR